MVYQITTTLRHLQENFGWLLQKFEKLRIA